MSLPDFVTRIGGLIDQVARQAAEDRQRLDLDPAYQNEHGQVPVYQNVRGQVFIAQHDAEVGEPVGVLLPGEGWTDLGYTDQDGLTWLAINPLDVPRAFNSATEMTIQIASPASAPSDPLAAMRQFAGQIEPGDRRARRRRDRVPIPPAPSTGDVLDRIDAVVDERCACGCGQPLPPDGESAYFASQDCQRRWHGSQATDPQEVYNRPDAASYVGVDSAHWPLSDQPATARPARAAPPVVEREPAPPPCPDILGAAYRHPCARCGPVVPHYEWYEWDDTEITAFGCLEPIRYQRGNDIRMLCPVCRDRLPGPLRFAGVRHEGDVLRLELGDGYASTRRTVFVAQLIQMGADVGAYVEGLWREMDRDLRRFQREWFGRAGDQLAARCADTNALFRNVGHA